MSDQTVCSLFQDQNMRKGDKVLIIDSADTDWMSDEEAGELFIEDKDMARAHKVLAKAAVDQASGEHDALFDDPSPDLWDKEDLTVGENKDFKVFLGLIQFEDELRDKALSVKVDWYGDKVSQQECWADVQRWNARRARLERKMKEDFGTSYQVQFHIQSPRSKGVVFLDGPMLTKTWGKDHAASRMGLIAHKDWCTKVLAGLESAEDARKGLAIHRAVQVTRLVKKARNKLWEARKKVTAAKQKMADENPDFWPAFYELKFLNMHPVWSNGVGEECDDPTMRSRALDRGVDLAWDYIRAKRTEDVEADQAGWGFYDTSSQSKIIEGNREAWAKVCDARRRFYLGLGICKRHKSVSKNRGALTQLAKAGQVYWWVKPSWYKVPEEEEQVIITSRLKKDPSVRDLEDLIPDTSECEESFDTLAKELASKVKRVDDGARVDTLRIEQTILWQASIERGYKAW